MLCLDKFFYKFQIIFRCLTWRIRMCCGYLRNSRKNNYLCKKTVQTFEFCSTDPRCHRDRDNKLENEGNLTSFSSIIQSLTSTLDTRIQSLDSCFRKFMKVTRDCLWMISLKSILLR